MTIVTPVAKADAFPRGTAVVITRDGGFTATGTAQSFLPGSVYSVALTGGHDYLGKPVRVGSVEFLHASQVSAVQSLTECCHKTVFERCEGCPHKAIAQAVTA